MSWVKCFGRALDAAGCDGSALLAEAGFDLHHLGGADARCPLTKTGKLWQAALEATGDEAFGVKLASYFTHTAFHSLGFGLSVSSTLKEAFERVQQYAHVVSDAVGYRFYRCGAEYHFYIEPRTEVPIEAIDALVGMYLRMCRSLIGRDFSPLAIELRRARPAVIADFERLWRAPLTFGAEHNRMRFDQVSIERALDGGNPELARLSDAVSARYLARIERYNMEARVRTVLTQRLQHGEPTQEAVAEILNVSARTLQRKLGGNGTTFRKIVDEIRRAQALEHFSTTEMSVNEVTHLLGFSCSASFTRAFKRWTGLSPSEWRASSGSRTLHASPRGFPSSVDPHAPSASGAYTVARHSVR
ncbi:MAG: AraC family transcriptional regulator [Steroidobacteraceae bacterium]